MPSDSCQLCGLPLRHGVFSTNESGTTYRFCCMGCRQVFSMLMDAAGARDPAHFKETDLFKQCVAMGIVPGSALDLEQMAEASGRMDASFWAEHQSGEASGIEHGEKADGTPLHLNLDIDGMWCPACAWVVEESLRKQDGVLIAACNFSTDKIRCAYDPVSTSPDRIVEAVNRLGYRAVRSGEGHRKKDRKSTFVRFGISAFLTMNVMMLSFSLYSGFFTRLPADAIAKLSWPIFFMAGVVIVYGGRQIMWRAWVGLVSGAPGMETLIAMGAVSAFIYSTYNLLTGSIHLYFDTASMLITLVLLGKILERRAKDAIQENLGGFFSLRPKKVRICTDSFPSGKYVSANQLKSGDVFRIGEGEIVPADGRILSGAGLVDESSITGESLPVSKRTGDHMNSGSRVLENSFKIQAEHVGSDAILGQMIAVMEASLNQKTPLEGQTDRVLLWFVPVVAALALGTGMMTLALGHTPETALIRAITVLVVSCPCSLGIAIPLARVAGVALAGKQGILIRRFSAFEMAEHVDRFVFDKTGTITGGRWRLQEICPMSTLSRHETLALAAGLEMGSDHFIALEIRRQAEKLWIRPAAFEAIACYDNGVIGRLDGKVVRIGSSDFAFGKKPGARTGGGKEVSGDGTVVSSVFMSVDGNPCAVFTFGDRVKPGVHQVIESLKGKGYRPALISGDGDHATRSVAANIGIDIAFGGMLPQDKAVFIESLQSGGDRVAMVGDGINDAPALAKADLAVAIHSGYPLGKEAADITLMRGDPEQVMAFMDLAARVNKKIFQNLLYALVYNVVAIPVAMIGLLTPLVAVCAMLLSSLSVIGNTMILLNKKFKS